jgi:broad specificity phosphatase PhoE
MQTAIIVQHCQSQHHVDRTARLWPDSRNGLTEFGQRQALCAAQRLREEINGKAFRLYTSPMKRTTDTAEILGGELGMQPEIVYDLHEYLGRSAMERTEVGEEWQFDEASITDHDLAPFQGAETWREFYTRVGSAMDGLTQKHPDDELAVFVVHGGTLTNIVTCWLGLPLDVLLERWCFRGSPGSISILNRNQFGNPILERLNDRSHLANLD